MPENAVFVPHFHGDREWYEPFQVFRYRLVTALDTVLATAEADPDFRFTVDGQMAAIEDYLQMRPENARDRVTAVVTGELRSHARGNILPGVLSVRLALKQGMAVAERTVDHAERLNAQWSDRDESPFLALAWHKIIESTAHDPVVGSGTDETSEQVGSRLAEATQAARAVRDAALAEAAQRVPSDAFLVANPLPVPRTTLIEVDVASEGGDDLVAIAADGTTHPVQPTAYAPTVLSDERIDAGRLERVLRRTHRRELFGRLIDRYDLSPGRLVFHLGRGAAAAGIRPDDPAPGRWRRWPRTTRGSGRCRRPDHRVVHRGDHDRPARPAARHGGRGRRAGTRPRVLGDQYRRSPITKEAGSCPTSRIGRRSAVRCERRAHGCVPTPPCAR